MRQKGFGVLPLVMSFAITFVATEVWAQCLTLKNLSPPSPVVVENPGNCRTKFVLFSFTVGFTGIQCAGIVQDTAFLSFSGGGSGVEGVLVLPSQQTLPVGVDALVQFLVRVTQDAQPQGYSFFINATSILDGFASLGPIFVTVTAPQ